MFISSQPYSVASGAGVTFLITKDMRTARRSVCRLSVSPKHTTAHASLTINTPGKYFVAWRTTTTSRKSGRRQKFKGARDTVGPARAGKHCFRRRQKFRSVSPAMNNWNCVGESSEWKRCGFRVLFKNPTPSAWTFIGIVFYQQGSDGKKTLSLLTSISRTSVKRTGSMPRQII